MRDNGSGSCAAVTGGAKVLNGRFISLARADLAAALFQACDGIPAHFGVSIAELQPDSEGAIVTLCAISPSGLFRSRFSGTD